MKTKLLSTLSYAHALDAMAAMARGKHRFSDIMFELQVNPGILGRLFNALVAEGVVARADGERAYDLTEKGVRAMIACLDILDLDGEDTHELRESLARRLVD